MGRVTSGVRGMTLEDDDVVIGMVIVNEQFTDSTLFTVTENGFGKRTELTDTADKAVAARGSSPSRPTSGTAAWWTSNR